ncbi:MAG: leucine-rich repeat domain-containing protein [Bacteroidales bacterium]|nr:leucine-rich repeat domain-containing protein [Bacteroidales bacterium]
MKKIILFIAVFLSVNVLLGQEQFRVNGLIYEVIGENEVEVIKCIKDFTEIEIPATITNNNNITYDVTKIGMKAFFGLTRLSSVVIPNSVKEIGNYCFASCSALSSVVISDSIKHISSGMFKNCIALTDVNFPNNLVSIRHGAFSGCKSLSFIDLPEGIKEIEDYAFAYCESLRSVFLPKSITFLGEYAFYDSKVKLDKIIEEEFFAEEDENNVASEDFYLINKNIYVNKNNRFVTDTNIPLVWIMPKHKSVFGAGLLSFVLPGWGQLYATDFDKGWEYVAWSSVAFPGVMIGLEVAKNGDFSKSTKEMFSYIQILTTCIHLVVGVASALDAVEIVKKVNMQNGYMSFFINDNVSLGIKPDVSYNNFLNPNGGSAVLTTGLGFSLSF